MPLGVYPKNSYQKASCCPVVVNRYCSFRYKEGYENFAGAAVSPQTLRPPPPAMQT